MEYLKYVLGIKTVYQENKNMQSFRDWFRGYEEQYAMLPQSNILAFVRYSYYSRQFLEDFTRPIWYNKYNRARNEKQTHTSFASQQGSF